MNNNLNKIPQMLRITDIAEMYGLPVHFVRTLVNSGEVVAVRVGNKILVNAEKFSEFLDSNTLYSQEKEQSPKPNEVIIRNPRIAPISRKQNR